MSIDIAPCEHKADVLKVLLSGRLDMADSESVRLIIQQALEDSGAGILVDIGALEFISSSGLRALIAAQKDATATGKAMALVSAQPGVYKIFKVSGLDSVFTFFEDEADAVKELWG